jgi:predicted DNA-binding antitoxin AbrB/MazE fold protein
MAMRTVRFMVRKGHLEPLEPVALVEGTEVDVQVADESVVATAGVPATIVAAMRRLPDIDPSAVDDLERAIEAGKLPVRSESVFDHPKA